VTSLMLARLEDSPDCGHSGGVNHYLGVGPTEEA
jgi:hypothetical protein